MPLSKGTLPCSSYPSCEETRCELRVYTGDSPPEEVTSRLGISPTSINRAGETRTNELGRTRVIPFNGWFLSSEGIVASRDTRDHLDWLLAQLIPIKDKFNRLQQEMDGEIGINCVWYSKVGHGGPVLWPEQMRLMSELDLECGFDIYFFEE